MEAIMVSDIPYWIANILFWFILLFMPDNQEKHPILSFLRWPLMGVCLGAEIMYLILTYMIEGV